VKTIFLASGSTLTNKNNTMSGKLKIVQSEVDAIVNEVCTYFDCDSSIIKPKNRLHKVVYARQCIIYFICTYFPSITRSEVGAMMNTDHTGVYYSFKAISDKIKHDKKVRADVQILEAKLNERLSASKHTLQAVAEDNNIRVLENLWTDLKLSKVITKEDFISYYKYLKNQSLRVPS
jgi:hypothetical protein